jgi:hypothetical protein
MKTNILTVVSIGMAFLMNNAWAQQQAPQPPARSI